MSTFELDLDNFGAEPLDVELAPSDEEVRSLFDDFEEDFRVESTDGFVFDLQATLDGTSVLVWGRVAGEFVYRCGRCLTERDLAVESSVDITVLSRSEWEENYVGEEEIALEAEDLDVDYYEGETVDLAPLIRDALSMELPAWPQCPDELRDECDAAYEEHVGDDTLDKLEKHEVDLRWWPLRDIDLEEEGDGEGRESETD